MQSKKKPSYAIGDLVKVKSENIEGLVDAVSADTGELEYGVNGISWFYHDDLTLIANATAKSVIKVLESSQEEDNESEEL